MAATAPPAPAVDAPAMDAPAPPAPPSAVPLPTPVSEAPFATPAAAPGAAPTPAPAATPAPTPVAAPVTESKAFVPAPPAADAGALVPHETKPSEHATEAGTIIHMEKATQKIEHDKIATKAKAWEEDALARIESRNQRDEAKIAAEELTMKNKAEARLRRNEEKLEKQRAKYLAPKRPRDPRYNVEQFKDSASKFAEYEEKALKIVIKGTKKISGIFSGCNDVETDSDLDHLKLEGFEYDQILTFAPDKFVDMSDNQRRFLMKLKRVLMNNAVDSPDNKCEPYIQAMVDVLLQECKLDDSLNLEVLPSRLKITVGERTLSTFSDREGRKGEHLVWVLQETKHKYDRRYKGGEIQLISSIIAACQQNHSVFGEGPLPQVMYGINVRDDEVSILRTVVTKEYLLSLFGGLPQQVLSVKKYPKNSGLKLSSYESRCEILSIMTKLRKHALSIGM